MKFNFLNRGNKKKEPKKVSKNSQSVTNEDPLAIYVHILYKFVGRRLFQYPKFKDFFYNNIYNVRYENILKQANLRILPEEYFISIMISISLVFLSSSLATIIWFPINPLISSGIFFGGIVGTTLLGILFYNYPVLISKNRGSEIDASIPYLLPYLKILSKEVNLSKIIEIIDEFLIYKEIQVEFRKIKYYSSFLGYDIQTSIREAMLSCPSRSLSDLMNDLVTISNSGGDIYAYLERKLMNLNEEIEAFEKKNIDTLLILSQIYVVLLLIAPLFFTIMVSILDLINFTSSTEADAGVSSVVLIIFLLIILPFVYAGFMMIIYYSKPLYARLQPIKDGTSN